MNNYSKLTIKVPPPLVTLCFAGVMFLTNSIINIEVTFFIKNWLVAILLVVSFFLLLPAVIQFYKNNTTVNPLCPEKANVLVIQGVYRYSRNPMYLGMALILFAWGLSLANPVNLITFIGFILYMNNFQIKAEEQALEKIFGDDFTLYAAKVRRWI